MKKIITAIACAIALFTLFGCNANNSFNDSSLGGDKTYDITPSDNDTTLNNDSSSNGDNSHAITPPVKDITPNLDGEIKELLSADELVEFHLNGNKYPENFVFDELVGYGRVIKSSYTQDEVHAVVEEHFTNSSCTVVENKLCVETDLFYGVYVKWAYQSKGMTSPTYYD